MLNSCLLFDEKLATADRVSYGGLGARTRQRVFVVDFFFGGARRQGRHVVGRVGVGLDLVYRLHGLRFGLGASFWQARTRPF